MLTLVTDNILFSYISMFSFLVRLFAVFLKHFQRISRLDLIKIKVVAKIITIVITISLFLMK